MAHGPEVSITWPGGKQTFCPGTEPYPESSTALPTREGARVLVVHQGVACLVLVIHIRRGDRPVPWPKESRLQVEAGEADDGRVREAAGWKTYSIPSFIWGLMCHADSLSLSLFPSPGPQVSPNSTGYLDGE